MVSKWFLYSHSAVFTISQDHNSTEGLTNRLTARNGHFPPIDRYDILQVDSGSNIIRSEKNLNTTKDPLKSK